MSANAEARKLKRSVVIKKQKEEAKAVPVTEAKAVLRNVRIAPRKVRVVIDLVRGKNVKEALSILKFTPKAGAPIVEKLLNSAVANAENNFGLDTSKLYVSEVFADQAAIMKRVRPRAQGRAFVIRKKASHITLKVKEK